MKAENSIENAVLSVTLHGNGQPESSVGPQLPSKTQGQSTFCPQLVVLARNVEKMSVWLEVGLHMDSREGKCPLK